MPIDQQTIAAHLEAYPRPKQRLLVATAGLISLILDTADDLDAAVDGLSMLFSLAAASGLKGDEVGGFFLDIAGPTERDKFIVAAHDLEASLKEKPNAQTPA